MMVNALTGDGRSGLSRTCGAVCLSGVSVLGGFSVKSSPSLLLVSMMKFFVLYWDQIMVVLLGTEFVSICMELGNIWLTESPCER